MRSCYSENTHPLVVSVARSSAFGVICLAMIQNSEILKPVNMIGALCITTAVCGLLVFFITRAQGPEFSVFISVIVIWHLLTGVGIWLRTAWGFSLIKFYLYCLLLGFPIGTFIAKRVLSHIRDNNLQNFFGVKSIEL